MEVYKRAVATIEAVGTVVGGYLCVDDDTSRVIFTFAKRATTTWIGVLTVEA